MTRKEMKQTLADNPGCELFINHTARLQDGKLRIRFHEQVSKTTALRNASKIKSAIRSTYAESRPDLAPLVERGTDFGKHISTLQVVTFYTHDDAQID